MKISNLLTILAILAGPIQIQAAEITGNFSYEKFQRLNSPEKQTQFDDWTAISVVADGELLNSKSHIDGDFRLYVNNENKFNFSVPEAYMEWTDRESRLSVGRQVLNWNENEEYWLLSNINSNQGFYLLGEKKEGLVGVQYDKRLSTNVTASFFFSYLNVPSLNPAVEIKDGKVSSNSEWVRSPPEATVIEGQEIPLHFSLNDPDIARDILLKKSLGARLAYAWDKDRSEVSAYFLYKPEGNIRMNAEAYMAEDLSRVEVVANPIVNHHAVYGLQYRQRFGSVRMVAGFDVNDPNAKLGKDFDILDLGTLKQNNKVFESEYFSIKPAYDKESYFHTSANLNRGSYMLSVNYIHNVTDNDRGSDDFYSETVKWKRAVGGRVRYYFDDFFNVMIDMKYDIERRDNILKAEVNYSMFNRASFNVGMELIKSPEDTSYWAAYRANDAVYSSLKFLF
ncbi:MAG: hypothetical protein BM556_01410 [Bacteriovorax sp. MedPE-SWde]|nr:MAG: hypothetical protein BM556_01410 [Bacteriovorax sp. MedPE-SWde]